MEIAYIDLFSGIGGFAEGFRRAGLKFTFHAFSEIDQNAISIYKKHFPDAEGLGDVSTIRDFSRLKKQRGGVHWLLLSDFLVKIFPLLAKDEVLKVHEVGCSLKQSGLLKRCSLNILSLKTSKACLQVTEDQTLSDVCEKLPTLGIMTANGNLSILAGFYPKIESGFTLSDILEENPDPKYFLSRKATSKLLEYQNNKLTALQQKELIPSERMLLNVNSYRK